MAGPVPNLVPFDYGALDSAVAGGQQRQTLADLGAKAAQGDYDGAAATAFAGGQPDIAAHLAQMSAEQHQQIVQDAASGAYAADTPEKWDAFTQQFHATHPTIQVPPFAARNAVIAQAQTVQDQIANSQKNRELDIEAQKANTAANPMGGLAAADNLPMVETDTQGAPDAKQQQDFLAQLDPGTARLVQDIADYKMDISKVTSLRGNERRQVAQLVGQYDPSFDMTQYGARAAMRKSITSGSYSQALNSSNLVIQHLDALSKAVDDLHNTGIQPWNAASNALKNASGDPAITKFNTIADAAASELAKVFKGTGATDLASVEEWRRNLSANASPDQIHAAIDTAVGDLLKSRIDTINTQYQSAMGKPAKFTFLTPHSRQVLQDLGLDPTALDPTATPPASGGGDASATGGANAPADADIDALIKQYAP